MTGRDCRGRFVNADEAAATRVLEAAVREAVRLFRDVAGYGEGTTVAYAARDNAQVALNIGGQAADLLLTARPPKKTARKGMS